METAAQHIIKGRVVKRVLVILLVLIGALGQVLAQNGAEEQNFARAARALAQADYPAAETGFRAVLKTAPKHIGALGNLGVVYSRTQQLDKAIAVYHEALLLAPKDPQLLLNLGLVYLRANAEAEALPIFRRLVAVNPSDPRARQLLATSEIHAGNPRRGVDLLVALRSQGNTDPSLSYLLGVGYLKVKEYDMSRSAFADMLSVAPPGRASLLLCQAYYESGRLEDAESECREAISADPSLEGAHRELGKVLVSRRDPAAETELRKAVTESRDTDAEALYFLGAWLVQNDRAADALPFLEKAQDRNPGFWGNYFYLGRARLASKQIPAAIELLEKAAKLNGAESTIFYQLGRAYTAAGQPDKAKAAMNRVRELKARDLAAETVSK